MKIISYIIAVFLLVGCASRNFPVLKNKPLLDLTEKYSANSSLLENIDFLFENCKGVEIDGKSIAAIYSNSFSNLDRGDYFIDSVLYVSSLYYYPPTAFFLYKDEPVLIYIRKEGFSNPNLYTDAQRSLFLSSLIDNWNLYYHKSNSDSLKLPFGDGYFRGNGNLWLRHPERLKVRNGKAKVIPYYKFHSDIYLQPSDDVNFFEELKLENLRVKMTDTLFFD